MKKLLFLFLLFSNTCFASSTATVFDNDTKLMLHANAASDASTTFIDSSRSSKTVTANGDAQLDTAQKKFGTASGLFDGTGDYLSIPDSDDWYFGTGDFTIDFWVRYNALPGHGDSQMFYSQVTDANNYVAFFVNYFSGEYKVRLIIANAASYGYLTKAGLTINTGQWYHYAYTRSSTTTWKIFIDGTDQSATWSGTLTTSEPIANYTQQVEIGSLNDSGRRYYFNGWIDELRVVKGTAIWTSNFTAPSNEYQNPTNFFQVM